MELGPTAWIEVTQERINAFAAATEDPHGTNRVRFLAPVPSGSRVRGRFRVLEVEGTPRGARATVEAPWNARAETSRPASPIVFLSVS